LHQQKLEGMKHEWEVRPYFMKTDTYKISIPLQAIGKNAWDKIKVAKSTMDQGQRTDSVAIL